MHELAVDVRDAAAVREALGRCDPEVVLHLAAQPMVRRSLRDPLLTYEVNVMGTVNLLEAVRGSAAGVRAVVVVTSDKCYENRGGGSRRFVEDDPLGGEDPVLELEGLRRARHGRLPALVLLRRTARPRLATRPRGQRDRRRRLGRGPAAAGRPCAPWRAARRCSSATPTRCARGSTCSARSAATCGWPRRSGGAAGPRAHGTSGRRPRTSRRSARSSAPGGAVGRGASLAARRSPQPARGRRSGARLRGRRTRARVAPGVRPRARADSARGLAPVAPARRGHARVSLAQIAALA